MKWQHRRAGRESAEAPDFTALMLPHLDSAHNLARWLVRDASLAEDVVQDAFLRALRYFPSFAGGDARAWLLRIVRNVAYGALTRSRQEQGMPLDEDAGADVAPQLRDPRDNPEASLQRRQDMHRLQDAIAALPPTLRECLVLRELEELSYKQIALVAGVPVGTVMSRLWRARRRLIDTQAEALAHGGSGA